jgi:hypothetical protein
MGSLPEQRAFVSIKYRTEITVTMTQAIRLREMNV